MKVIYADWDDDHRHPTSIKTIGGHLETSGPLPGVVITHLAEEDQVRLSFSVVGVTCDVVIAHEEWAAIRDRIDSLFGEAS